MITISAFGELPTFAHGLARDLRVRWALEEAGLAYREKLVALGGMTDAAYRALQPFGAVPVADFDGLVLFESGAIVHHVAESCDTLMPDDAPGRARARMWMFAALNTVEPAVQALVEIDLFHAAEPWAAARRPTVMAKAEKRLDVLVDRLADRDYLEDRFTAGDLLMVTVLRILRHTDLVTTRPKLYAYQLRCEARPAFGKALAAHLKPLTAASAA